MSKMKKFQVIALTLSMLMIISMVKGRWLDLETYSTSMTSVGVHNISNDNPPNLRLEISNSSTFYAEKRCKSLYGFFPCADTMLESVFLMFMYMYFMILGEELIGIGSKVLFLRVGDKVFNESVFGVLKALPRIAVFVVPGILSSASDAQNQVVFGVSMYAGSTVITLTLIWGIRIILSKDELKKRSSSESDHQQDSSSRHNPKKGSSRESDHQQDSSMKCMSLLTDTGVNIDEETGVMALNMLLSLIPFAFVGLLHFISTPAMTLFALIVSVVSLLLYFGYQVRNPQSRFRSLAYLKEEILKARFFYHVMKLAVFEDLVNKEGGFDLTSIKRIFAEVDNNQDEQISPNVDNNQCQPWLWVVWVMAQGIQRIKGIIFMVPCIGHQKTNLAQGSKKDRNDELGDLVQKLFMLEDDNISKEYAKAAILIHFDTDQNGTIIWEELEKGYTKWLEEATSSGSVFENIWKRVKEKVMMRKILEQVLENHRLMKEDGKPDREKIKGLFSQHCKNSDDVIPRDELKKIIENLDFGTALGHDKVLGEYVKNFNEDKNLTVEKKDTEEKIEFVNEFIKWIVKKELVNEFIKWIEKTIDPKKAIDKFAEDWAEIHALLKPEKPKATIVYALFGMAITFTVTSPFIASVRQFSTAAHIPFLFTSFVMAPIAMKAKIVIVALLNFQHRVRKNPSLKFSEIYDQLVMDNLIGFASLLLVVYIRGLSWTYSAEVLAIMIPCAIVGVFAIKRDTYPLWAAVSAILLYPVSVYIYYVLPNAS